MNVIDRITSLRSLMREKNIDGYLIYGTDPHLSEYVPEAWRSREWISGFTGSYGKVAITQDYAALWTDSRYFIQAESQLSGTKIVMIKDRQADTISVDNWMKQKLKPGSIVAIDGLTISAAEANTLELKLSANGIILDLNADLVSPIWENRPILSQSVVTDFPIRFAGHCRSEKLAQIRNQLTVNGSKATLVCQLDDLAWSFNLRGKDISYNPLFTGYGYVDQEQAILFIDDEKVPTALKDVLEREGVHVINYESIFSFLKQLKQLSFYLDPDRTNSLIYRLISKYCKVNDGLSIPTFLKSVKNEVETLGIKEAHIRDGVAMVNFLFWFDKHFGKKKITELSIAEELGKFRSEQAFYMGESFSPIVAFGVHGAIVHYSATSESEFEVLPDSILLIDSGGQYLDGTTDLTRTIATGKITLRHQTDFTLVLKGMIQLAKAVFPENTKGYSLDILARKALWSNGLNYGHGTGHGVGHYLSVHEGPMAIRQEYNGEPIRAGQIITDEPGLYREGEYGIRIENVLVCKEECQSKFGRFLSFDTLTLCPIDRKLVDRQLLADDELKWLNAYHARVLKELGTFLNTDVFKWLKAQCSTI
ncbi:MAG: aminopeptidase P family protein [Bacteroidia bacterium]|nr:aminopeptidase P family protein [Bacteroidia bacterium]